MLVGNNANEVSLFSVILGSTSMLPSSMMGMANSIFTCPSANAAKARADNKVKSWRYLYSGDWPNQKIAEG
jgi:cholinesterase